MLNINSRVSNWHLLLVHIEPCAFAHHQILPSFPFPRAHYSLFPPFFPHTLLLILETLIKNIVAPFLSSSFRKPMYPLFVHSRFISGSSAFSFSFHSYFFWWFCCLILFYFSFDWWVLCLWCDYLISWCHRRVWSCSWFDWFCIIWSIYTRLRSVDGVTFFPVFVVTYKWPDVVLCSELRPVYVIWTL